MLVLRSLFPISKFDFGKAFTEFVVVDAWIQFYVSTQSCSTSLHSAKQQSEGESGPDEWNKFINIWDKFNNPKLDGANPCRVKLRRQRGSSSSLILIKGVRINEYNPPDS